MRRFLTGARPSRLVLRALLLLQAAGLAAGLEGAPARADEGMWTFDAFPSERVRGVYGQAPDAAWLEKVRLASVRLGRGCSGAFVSSEGLVLTNHHCVLRCVEQLSRKKKDLVARGFHARAGSEERRCPALEVNQLVEITDVTDRVEAATKGTEGEAFQEARRAVIAEIEGTCATSEARRCDVVSLYRGGLYHLYTYRRFQDVRLVFAPEIAVAFFGGDPDNFNFPRYNLDFAFLRAYEDKKPAAVDHWLSLNPEGPKAGELVFMSGHPGATRRLLTVAQLEYIRDHQLPETLLSLAELRGRLARMATEGPEARRISKATRFGVENAYKAYRGRRASLVDDAFFASIVASEAALREQIADKPEVARAVGDAYETIARAVEAERDLRFALRHIMAPRAYGSALFGHARTLVRWAAEREKPSAERLPELADAKLPRVRAAIGSTAPIYPKLEAEILAFAFEEMRRDLGPDHPFVRLTLEDRTPRALAENLTQKTRLTDPAVREELFEGGRAAIERSDDPMIELAKRLDPMARELRERYENEIEAVVDRAAERIAQARFTLLGREVYPDATSSLRLTYGKVAGFPHLGEPVEPFTKIRGLFARATGQPPFALPPSVRRAKAELDLDQRLNFTSTNDIIGGNSGSPVIDIEGRLVGVVFDGNIYSLGGDFGFDGRVNRAVSVHAGAIVETLEEVWKAKRLLRELGQR